MGWGWQARGHLRLKSKFVQAMLDKGTNPLLELLIDSIEDIDVSANSDRADILVNHEDPDIRLALAKSYAPMELKHRLLDDSDPDVRDAVRENWAE